MTLRGEKTLARLERQRAKLRARFAAGQCVHGLCPLPSDSIRADPVRACRRSLRGSARPIMFHGT
jgi:hypothetical protein